MSNEKLIKGILLAAGAALLYYLGRWIGGGLTSSLSNGTVLTGILLCLVWFGYLSYARGEADSREMKFAEKAISAVILAFPNFASSIASLTAFCESFEPSVGTRIFLNM